MTLHFPPSLVAPEDYKAVLRENLVFQRGDARVCHSVAIEDDDRCEVPYESFFSDLSLVSGISSINIICPTTEVIINDTAQSECG